MHLVALSVDALHVALQAVGHDFVDLAVIERRAKAAGQAIHARWWSCAQAPRAIARSDASTVSMANRTERGKSALSRRNSATRSGRTSAV